jgi:hypothetical protein
VLCSTCPRACSSHDEIPGKCQNVVFTPDFTNTMPRGMLSFAKHPWRRSGPMGNEDHALHWSLRMVVIIRENNVDSPMDVCYMKTCRSLFILQHFAARSVDNGIWGSLANRSQHPITRRLVCCKNIVRGPLSIITTHLSPSHCSASYYTIDGRSVSGSDF